MHTAAPFKCKRLLNAHLHIGRVLEFLIVKHKTTLPERADRLYALYLLRFLPFVRHNGKLVSTQVALVFKLVKNDVLHEVCLHEEAYGRFVPRSLVEVIEPTHHAADRVLAYIAVDEMQLIANLAPQAGSLVVVGRR